MENVKQEVVIYKNQAGNITIDVLLEDETVWLNQSQMAELFQKSRFSITRHIQNIFKEKELEENSVCRKFRHTANSFMQSIENFK
jgi:hypothetical protein